KDAERKGKGIYLWDTELRGFGCRAAPSGGLTWLFQHWVGGKGGMPKRMAFNSYPPMGIDDARAEAEKLRGEVNKGADLLDRKAKARIAKRQALHAIKLGDAVARYLKRKSKPGSYWIEVRRKFEREVVPTLGADTVLASLVKSEVRALIEEKLDKGHHG